MGIILVVNAWMVPFIKTFGVDKGKGLSHFSVSIDSPHALYELVKEYFKIPMPDSRGYSTGTVDEDDKDVEEVDDDGSSVDNGVCNTNGVVENHFQKNKRSEVDTYLNAIGKNDVEEDTVNENRQESSKSVNSDTSIVNDVDGSITYDQ